MEIILARHGEPVVAHSDEGPVNPELTERGHWQAERLGAWLACEPIDCVVTSSMLRAQQTAQPLQRQLGIENDVVKDFDEIDRQSRVYAPFHLMKERFPEHYEAIQREDWAALGWDPPERFGERVLAAWEDLLARRPGECVFIACHGGVIGSITSHLLGLSSRWAFANPPFASYSRIRVSADGRAQLLSANEVGHFDATRTRAVGPEGEGFGSVG